MVQWWHVELASLAFDNDIGCNAPRYGPSPSLGPELKNPKTPVRFWVDPLFFHFYFLVLRNYSLFLDLPKSDVAGIATNGLAVTAECLAPALGQPASNPWPLGDGWAGNLVVPVPGNDLCTQHYICSVM